MRPLLDHTITVEEISRLIGVTIDLDPTLTFSGATSVDSSVNEGDLFLAYPGEKTHGAQFAAHAIALGARAILTDAQGHDHRGPKGGGMGGATAPKLPAPTATPGA